jgi:hypothetical protein
MGEGGVIGCPVTSSESARRSGHRVEASFSDKERVVILASPSIPVHCESVSVKCIASLYWRKGATGACSDGVAPKLLCLAKPCPTRISCH